MKPSACWILCTPRTGSTLLCELLNNLGSFPVFEHPGMKTHRGVLEVGQTFSEWPRLYANPAQFCDHPPPYSKMIFHQYVEVMAAMPKNKQYNVGWYPEKHDKDLMAKVSGRYNIAYARSIFPDIKFLHLRRDRVSHAVSLYFARTTKKYHIYDRTTLDNYINIDIECNESRLLEAYCDAADYDQSWRHFLSGQERVLQVNYAALLADMPGTLSEIVGFLGCGGDVAASIEKTHGEHKRIYRMTRPEAEYYEAKLRSLVRVKLL